MTPGQRDYERDLQLHPRYHDGKLRKTWAELTDLAKHSWETAAANHARWKQNESREGEGA